MAPPTRSQWALAALTATCLASFGATAALALQTITSTKTTSVGALQPAVLPIVTLQIDFEVPLESAYYALGGEERKLVREQLYANAMAFFPYGAPPAAIQLTSTRSLLSRDLLRLELGQVLTALAPGLGVASTQMPLKYVIIDGQPMCVSSFDLTSYQIPVWTSAESSGGPVSAAVRASLGIPE